MKFFLVILGLIFLAAGIYFWLGAGGAETLSNNASSTYAEFLKKLAVLNNIKQKGLDIFNGVSGFVTDTEKKITGVKFFLDTAPKTVSSTISDIYSQVKNQLPPAAVKLLSGESGQSPQNFIFPGGQFSVATSTNGSFQENVCVEFSSGSGVDYSIQNPFSPPRDYAYRINWGDGSSYDGGIKAGDAPLTATHYYAKPGNYLNLFNITSASTTLDAQVRVCIN